MPKQNVTLELNVPDGYEVIAIRHAGLNDIWCYILHDVLKPEVYKNYTSRDHNVLILREKYKFPEFIKNKSYLYCNTSGWWCVSETQPVKRVGNAYWESVDGRYSVLDKGIDWVPPKDTKQLYYKD